MRRDTLSLVRWQCGQQIIQMRKRIVCVINEILIEQPSAPVDSCNEPLLLSYVLFTVFFRDQAQYRRAQRIVTQSIQDFNFRQRSQVAFVVSPRGDLRACQGEAVGQLRIAIETTSTFQLIEQLVPIELHRVIAKKMSKLFDTTR